MMASENDYQRPSSVLNLSEIHQYDTLDVYRSSEVASLSGFDRDSRDAETDMSVHRPESVASINSTRVSINANNTISPNVKKIAKALVAASVVFAITELVVTVAILASRNGTDEIYGGWTTWSEWGSCSVTCDIGMQQRDRSCSNPSPSADGDFCHGDAREYRMCIESACANGAWSTWSVWSHCSVTCGTGLQTRQRQCDNPKPSPLGTYCIGSSESVNICFEKACDAGGWTNWNSWSGCSVTCGGGIHSRSRTCTNPIPSGQGHYCVGDSSIVQSCNNKRCPAVSSAFAVSGPKEYSSSLSFSTSIYRIGNDFNINTGVLTCTIPGIYIFSTTLVKMRTSTRTVDRVYCDLMQNDVIKIKVYVDPTDDDSDLGSTAVTQTVVLHLNLHDRVYLSGCTPTTSMESWTSFSGFLLTPDN